MLPKTALVTGGYGFIGSHLVEMLIDFGVDVIIVDDLSSGNTENVSRLGYTFYQRDVCDYNSLMVIFKRHLPDTVFHLAVSKRNSCDGNPQKDLLVNAGGMLNVLRCCVDTGVKRIVYSSTGSVYGKVKQMPITEKSPVNPLTFYGVSKLCAENYVKMFHQTYELDYNILRYFHVYGPKQRCADRAGGVVGVFCRRALQGKPLVIHGDGKQVRLFTNVKDVVKSTFLAGVSGVVNETYNVTSNKPVTILGLTQKLKDILGSITTKHTTGRLGEVYNWDVSNEKIAQLGMKKWAALDDGIIETFAWYAGKYG